MPSSDGGVVVVGGGGGGGGGTSIKCDRDGTAGCRCCQVKERKGWLIPTC